MRKRERSSCEKLRRARQNHEISGSLPFQPFIWVTFLSSSTSIVEMPEMRTNVSVFSANKLTLKLVRLEDLDQSSRNNPETVSRASLSSIDLLVESSEERVHLLLDRFLQAVLAHKADVLCLVFLCNRNGGATGLELDNLRLSKGVVLDRELLLTVSGDEAKRLTSMISVMSLSSIHWSDLWNSGSTLSRSRMSTLRPRICL